MKKAFCLFLLFLVCRSVQLLYAGTYTVDNLPMVYLQNKTKHVVNPDGILSAQTLLVPHGKYNGIHPLHRAERQHRYQVQQTGERKQASAPY